MLLVINACVSSLDIPLLADVQEELLTTPVYQMNKQQRTTTDKNFACLLPILVQEGIITSLNPAANHLTCNKGFTTEANSC